VSTYVGIDTEVEGPRVYQILTDSTIVLWPATALTRRKMRGRYWGPKAIGAPYLSRRLLNASLGDAETARRLSTRFTTCVVLTLPQHGWMMDDDFIREWVRRMSHSTIIDSVVDLGTYEG